MKKIKFPKTLEKPKLYWKERQETIVALVDLPDCIKLYYWDGISITWNYSQIYEKATWIK